MTKIQMPEWLKIANKNARVSLRDFAKVLGVTENALYCRLYKGAIPKPEETNQPHFSAKNGSRYYWRVATVRNYIRKLNRMSKTA